MHGREGVSKAGSGRRKLQFLGVSLVYTGDSKETSVTGMQWRVGEEQGLRSEVEGCCRSLVGIILSTFY